MTKILVVDDDPNSQEVLSDILGYHGMEVHAVSSGEDALDMLAAQPYDLAIIDLRLPGMDGWELFHTLRAEINMPCIAITVYDNDEVKKQTLKAGFAGYFIKPVNELTFGEDVVAIL